MEYTLEDAYEALEETESKRQIKETFIMNQLLNNPSSSCTDNSTDAAKENEVEIKKQKYYQYLLNQVKKEQPKDFPVRKTSDLRLEVLNSMEEEIISLENLAKEMEKEMKDIEKENTRLKNKKEALQQMEEVCINSTMNSDESSTEIENAVLKRLFGEIKADLYHVVDTIFPNNSGFKELLSDLTSALTKGGDDVYIDVKEGNEAFINFLLESDLIVFHRNDKNKIKMVDIL